MNIRILVSLLFTSLCLIWMGCEDDKEIFFEELKVEEKLEMVHAHIRDKPYPREGQLLYINPCPLIVPQELRPSGGFLEFELSQDMNFPEEGTYRSGKKSWNMYNVHKELEVGDWYWRYRAIDSTDKATSWSETIRFTITGDEERFVTPDWDVFRENLPKSHPYTWCFLDEYLPLSIDDFNRHPESSIIISQAKSALDYEIQEVIPYDNTILPNNVRNLMTAYSLTGEEKYRDKMLKIARGYIAAQTTYDELINLGNEPASQSVEIMGLLYDYCYNELTESERSAFENLIQGVSGYYFNRYKGSMENNINDNHAWQYVLRRITLGTFAICQKQLKAMEDMEYMYELWTARAPNTGFNRDGDWINGGGYFGTNIITLAYMPMLFSYVTHSNFLQHPWYRNAGKALLYSYLPETCPTSFGDQVGEWGYLDKAKAHAEFADFLARELQDPYAAYQVVEKTLRDPKSNSLRFYRVAKSSILYTDKSPDFENYLWNQDNGTGVAFSDMENPEKNLSLAFRSSPFGSRSHTLADQNSFKLLYKGDYVYRNAGYYHSVTGHNLLQYRHTRGHNTIMINNIGQAYDLRSYGYITRGLNGDNLAYFLGDASNAYYPFSDTWDEAFIGSGFSQTPEYGFGENPLNKYKRHIFMLRPDKVVIYDDLGADEPATWQWLLHSDSEFQIIGNKIISYYSSLERGNFVAIAQIFSNHTPIITKTNEWFMGIDPSVEGRSYPKQWHLTANFDATATNRILTVIQLNDQGESEENVWRANNNFVIGDWSIEAEMDGNKPAAISITNETIGTVFSYGNQAPVIEGATYQRKQENSSVLYDQVKGEMRVQEISDRPLYVTRTVK